MKSAGAVHVRALDCLSERELEALSEVLIDCVESGASVSFMMPLTRDRAEAFWRGVQASASRGERMLLVAEEPTGEIVGTVQVIWAQPENQPHRGEIAKMLVHRKARRQGVGAALLRAAEECAAREGKTLLVLDTASSEAARLYERGGWKLVGVIPDYALWPNGGLCATTIYFKALRGAH